MVNVEIEVDSQNKAVALETKDTCTVTENDYERLRNKPKLNGVVISGEMEESDPTVPSWAKAPNKPQYTPEELNVVGEDNVITLDEIDAIFRGL